MKKVYLYEYENDWKVGNNSREARLIMKKLLVIIMLMMLTGCGAKFKGVSVGATYLRTDMEIYGQEQEIHEFMPIILLNFGIE